MNPNAPYIAFESAAGAGCGFELRVRLLANVTPALSKIALAFKLDDVLKPVIEHFKKMGALPPDEEKCLTDCQGVRNKLFHVELAVARKRLIAAGATLNPGAITRVNLATGEAVEVVAEPDAPTAVFGWLLEAWTGGDFVEAEKLFRRGCDIATRLATDHAQS